MDGHHERKPVAPGDGDGQGKSGDVFAEMDVH